MKPVIERIFFYFPSLVKRGVVLGIFDLESPFFFLISFHLNKWFSYISKHFLCFFKISSSECDVVLCVVLWDFFLFHVLLRCSLVHI